MTASEKFSLTIIFVIPTNARMNVIYTFVTLAPPLNVCEGSPELRIARSNMPYEGRGNDKKSTRTERQTVD